MLPVFEACFVDAEAGAVSGLEDAGMSGPCAARSNPEQLGPQYESTSEYDP